MPCMCRLFKSNLTLPTLWLTNGIHTSFCMALELMNMTKVNIDEYIKGVLDLKLPGKIILIARFYNCTSFQDTWLDSLKVPLADFTGISQWLALCCH